MDNHLLQRITHNPDICHGKPCIRGLRYPVELVLELLSSGMTIEEILADYDDLEQEDVYAALLFAARLTQVKTVHKIASLSFSLMLNYLFVWLDLYKPLGMMPSTQKSFPRKMQRLTHKSMKFPSNKNEL